MKFTVHTNLGRFIVEANTPDDARAIVRRKHPGIVITKVKAKRG